MTDPDNTEPQQAGQLAVGGAGTAPPPRELVHSVDEVEQFVHRSGWDAQRQVFALVRTEELLAHEPGLIGQIGGSGDDPDGDLADHAALGMDAAAGADTQAEAGTRAAAPEYTPVEQGTMPGDSVAEALAQIAWPAEVAGCVLVLEIIAETGGKPTEGRLAVGVLRNVPGGACVLRWRDAPDGPLTKSPDLAPDLVAALHSTFEP